MTKAEMEEHWRRYTSFVQDALGAEQQGDFARVVELGEGSWAFIDGMLRHLARNDAETQDELEGIILVLRYAPLLFNYEVLDRLEQFLVGKRRIVKAARTDLDDDLSQARASMWRAHALWDELERQRRCKRDTLRLRFTGDDDEWHSNIHTWERMNVVVAFTASGAKYLSLATNMDDNVVAKCPSCGKATRRTKSSLLEPATCEHCTETGLFVHLTEQQIFEG